MSDEEIYEKLVQIYTQKLQTKQELTEDEIDFLESEVDFDELLENGKINEQFYSALLISALVNPSYQDMESADKANGIRSLKNLKFSNQKFGLFVKSWGG